MVQLGCAMDMMLLWVSSIISLELMAFLLSLGSTGAPKMILRTLDVEISLIVAPIFHSLAVYGPFWFFFRNDALVGLCYNSRAHDPINTIDSIGFRFRGRLLKGSMSVAAELHVVEPLLSTVLCWRNSLTSYSSRNGQI